MQPRTALAPLALLPVANGAPISASSALSSPTHPSQCPAWHMTSSAHTAATCRPHVEIYRTPTNLQTQLREVPGLAPDDGPGNVRQLFFVVMSQAGQAIRSVARLTIKCSETRSLLPVCWDQAKQTFVINGHPTRSPSQLEWLALAHWIKDTSHTAMQGIGFEIPHGILVTFDEVLAFFYPQAIGQDTADTAHRIYETMVRHVPALNMTSWSPWPASYLHADISNVHPATRSITGIANGTQEQHMAGVPECVLEELPMPVLTTSTSVYARP